ncbi:MAG: hypothetical protein JSS60_05445 [Verrucomicrobia bacterium]|nr:hypothetical protein [Verrucomicrobiota bacterium]
MKKCGVCSGHFEGLECPFGRGEELPLAEDYALMGQGKMGHGEHQRNVARWVLHGEAEHAESVVAWAKKTMQFETLA